MKCSVCGYETNSPNCEVCGKPMEGFNQNAAQQNAGYHQPPQQPAEGYGQAGYQNGYQPAGQPGGQLFNTDYQNGYQQPPYGYPPPQYAYQPGRSEKSGVATLLLLIFLGSIGVHRFYTGRIGLGLLYVFLSVVGYFTIAVWVDLILLLTSGLKDGDGNIVKV